MPYEYLVTIAESYLDEKMTNEEFDEEFTGYLFDHEEEIYENDAVFNLLDKIRVALSYFQPDPNIRGLDNQLLDEDQFRQVVQENIDQIKTLDIE